ncbi:MAG TPA: hypothetical protein VL371_14050 [Gemmataceae bacterium]|nr:hypothetical protein [Gemmataceae bacterium]
MKLLARTVRDLRQLGAPDVAFGVLVLAVVLAVELLGRHTVNDLHDLMALMALGLVGALVGLRHRRRPLRWVTRLGAGLARLGTSLRQATFEIGIDLRGTPRVRRGTPPIVVWLAAILAGWSILAALFAADCPHGLRAAAVGVFYLGYLVPLAFVWIVATAVSLLAFFIPAALIHDTFVAAHAGPGPRPRRREFWTICGYLLVLVTLGNRLPVAASLLICAATLLAYLVVCWLPERSEVRFVWRPHGTIRAGSMSWSRWVSYEFSLIALAVFALVLTTCGDRLAGGPTKFETMPVTAMIGLTLAWLAPGALVALFTQMALGRWRDPARSAVPVGHVAGVVTREQRRTIRAAFRAHGWRVRFGPAGPRPLDVPVELVENKLPQSDAAPPRWPLAVTVAELDDPALWQRLERRDQVQKRRKLLGSLEHLFKMAAGRRSLRGQGFWVAPHFWFIGGLMRDEQSEELSDESILSRVVGPPYHRVLPRAVRHHVYQMMRAVQIDLIFVEDGVGWRRLRRVLRALFEVYDVHAGHRPAEEVDFRGLPGTRVLIHDFQFDDPFKSETYPEPKYDFLGRARLLHVFRDRGEQEELIEPPFGFSRTPAPVSAV